MSSSEMPSWSAASFVASLVQVQNFQTGEVATTTVNMDATDSIPTNIQGAEFMSLGFTPRFASSALKIDVVMELAESGVVAGQNAALFQDDIVNAVAAMAMFFNASNIMGNMAFSHWMPAISTDFRTLKVRAGPNGNGTLTFNGVGSARRFGGVMASSITITEIAQ